MKRFLRKYWAIALLVFAGAGLFAASSDFTDFWTIKGTGTLNNTAIAWIDSARDFTLYDGDVVLGGSGSQPSTTAGAYPSLKVPFYNGAGAAMVQGNVVLSSVTTSSGVGTIASITSTTTYVGICEGSVAAGAIGYMSVSGYALVLTTGTVYSGDILVSSAPAVSAAKGYAGRLSVGAGDFVGVIIGRAMSTGPGLVLTKLE